MSSNKLLQFNLEELMGERYGRYSKYIIQDRALPDVRDGLKPVQRRILFAMHVDGNVFTKPHRKAAKTVGTVIGNYHPHGDSSVYDAMVRMSQPWKMNVPLVEMHGNNGSMDDDSPAAMRYTEARLSAISEELLRDIDSDTVSLSLTFDDTSYEPTVLPAHYPNLLVNGASGIASGYATYIPPHNLKEVIEGTILRIKNPNCTLDELMNVILGPDLPTGGIIRGIQGIRSAFETGSGQFQVLAKTMLEETKNTINLIVTEIPFEVIKSKLVLTIDRIRADKNVEGILEVRDESDREGLRIVIEMRKDADVDNIVNYLMQKTELSCKYNYNLVAICHKRPKLLSLIEVLDAYIQHQIEIITRKAQFDLVKAEKRLHIVAGLIIAVQNLDEVYAIIKSSKDKSEMKRKLETRFELDEIQSEAIVSLQLYRLSSTDINILKEEGIVLDKLVKDLLELIEKDGKKRRVLIDDLISVSKKFASDRKSILDGEIENFIVTKKPIISEDVMITITRDGYFKRTSLKSYNASENVLPGCKQSDILIAKGKANTVDTLLAFTNKGNYLYIPVYDLAETKWKEEGKHMSNLVALSGEEKIISALLVKEFKEGIYIITSTRNGLIKKTKLSDFQVSRNSKPIRCAKLDEYEDELVGVDYSDGDSTIVLMSTQGRVIQYHESKVSEFGIRAGGVTAMNYLSNNEDSVRALSVIKKDTNPKLLVLTDNGGYRIFVPNLLGVVSRMNKPSELYKFYKTQPHNVICLLPIEETNKVMMLTTLEVRFNDFVYERSVQLGKSIRSTLLSQANEKLITASTMSLIEINSSTPTYIIEEIKPISTKTNTEGENEEYNLTIFDYVDDL